MKYLISWWRYAVPNEPAKYVAGLAAFLVVALLVVGFSATPYKPASTSESYFYSSTQTQNGSMVRVEVNEVGESSTDLRVTPLEGANKGAISDVQVRPEVGSHVNRGDVMLIWQTPEGELSESISDFWRISGLATLVAMLLLAVFIISGYRGLLGLYGLFFSLGVIVFGIIPAVADGHNALMVSVVGAFVIATVSMLISHGFGKRARLAVIALYVSLLTVVALTLFGSYLGKLTGIYDETSTMLAFGTMAFDLHGVLLGGIIIATLGLLDDIVITQIASVEQISRADARLGTFELFKRGLNVGNSHIASLINTLALAYVGASLPAILALIYASGGQTILDVLNGEFIASEIVRTIVSSLALVLAVPIATLIAARVYSHGGSKQAIIDIFSLRRVVNGSSRNTSESKR